MCIGRRARTRLGSIALRIGRFATAMLKRILPSDSQGGASPRYTTGPEGLIYALFLTLNLKS